MAHAQQADPGLPHPKATGLTMAICGFAMLALATVLGVSLASNAADMPNIEDAAVTIITRPPATDMALIADAAPFDVTGCTVTAAARP